MLSTVFQDSFSVVIANAGTNISISDSFHTVFWKALDALCMYHSKFEVSVDGKNN
jgi:hypothetical protein